MKKKLTTEEDYRQRVDRVCMYIREHLDKEIDMRRLAVLSAFSPFHFHRIMRAYLKEPIGAFIIRTRVETAAKLLRYTDLPSRILPTGWGTTPRPRWPNLSVNFSVSLLKCIV